MNPFHDVMVGLVAWHSAAALWWVALLVMGVFEPSPRPLTMAVQWLITPVVVACGAVVLVVNGINGAFRSSDHNPPVVF